MWMQLAEEIERSRNVSASLTIQLASLSNSLLTLRQSVTSAEKLRGPQVNDPLLTSKPQVISHKHVASCYLPTCVHSRSAPFYGLLSHVRGHRSLYPSGSAIGIMHIIHPLVLYLSHLFCLQGDRGPLGPRGAPGAKVSPIICFFGSHDGKAAIFSVGRANSLEAPRAYLHERSSAG
jgi:hypothetical protein